MTFLVAFPADVICKPTTCCEVVRSTASETLAHAAGKEAYLPPGTGTDKTSNAQP